MAAVLNWRLPEPASIDVRTATLASRPSDDRFMIITVWGRYLAKRSQLVIDLADEVRGGASQRREQPVWAPPGSHPTAALLGEVEPSGVPPSASIPKTADQPEQDTYKRRPPFGNRTSTEPLPYAAAA